jgi:hypothetical protein
LLAIPDQTCAACREPKLLLGVTVAGKLCAACWHGLLCPPPVPATPEQAWAAELAIEKRMLARGGADRYRVVAGKS